MSLWSLAKDATVAGTKATAGALWKDSGAANITALNPVSSQVNKLTKDKKEKKPKEKEKQDAQEAVEQKNDAAKTRDQERYQRNLANLQKAREQRQKNRDKAKNDPAFAAEQKARREESKLSRQRGERERRDELQRDHKRLSRAGAPANVVAEAGPGEEFPQDVRVNIKGIRETLEDIMKEKGGLFGGGGGLGGAMGGALAGALAGWLKGKGGKLGKLGSLIGAASGMDIPDLADRRPQTTVPEKGGKAGNQPTRVPSGGKPPVAPKAPGRFGRIGGALTGMATAAASMGGSVIEGAKGIGSTIAEKASGAGKAIAEGASRAKTVVSERVGKIVDAGKGLVGAGAKEGAEKVAGKGAAKAAGKMAIKKVPIIGLLAGVGFGISRAAQGDWAGAGMEVASGLAGTVPGVGTAASVGIDGALIARDAMKEGQGTPTPQEPPKIAPSAPKFVSPTLSVQPSVTKAGARDDEERKVAAGLSSLDGFTRAALDEKIGVFVKPAQDELTKREQEQPGTAQAPNGGGHPSGFSSGGKRYQTVQRNPGALPAQGAAVTPVAPQAVSDRPRFNAAGQQVAGVAGGGNNSGVAPGEPTRQRTQNKDGSVAGFQGKGLAHSELGNLIARGEGDYNSYNAGTKGIAGGKVKHSGKKDLANMTLDEIIKSSESKDGNDKDRVFAAGRYQIITPTLKDAMKKMNLKGDEKFTPELQDRIFEEHLMPKGARDYIAGKSENKEKAQIELAQVWRSIADPRTGKTYADSGASANKASISADEISKALDSAKKAKADGSLDAAKAPTLQPTKANDANELASATAQANEAREKKAKEANTPIVVPAPAQAPAPQNTARGGNTGVGGHMGTRNDDTSIRRLTDAKMGA